MAGFNQTIRHRLVPNEVPSVSAQHLQTVRDIKADLQTLMQTAYPDAYEPNFEGRPELKIPSADLKKGIEGILNYETVRFLKAEEARLRPPYETLGLETAFGRLLPIAMAGFEDAQFQYTAVVDAQCIKCMKDGKKPQSGLNFGNKYPEGQPVTLDYFVDGGWKEQEIVATDSRLARDDEFRSRLTPSCERHGKDYVFQLAVVHRVTVVPPKSKERTYKRSRRLDIAPESPIFETRPKSSFELLWKVVKYLEGLKDDGAPDAFGARIRMPDEASLRAAILSTIKKSPLHWSGSIKPQNFDNVSTFYNWLSSGVTFPNGDANHLRALLNYTAEPERHNVFVKTNGHKRMARYMELFFPFGTTGSVLDRNAISILCYTDKEYTDLQGTIVDESGQSLQNRLGYHLRRLGKREESTWGEWLIASRLSGISIDPSNIAYNRMIIGLRLKEAEEYTLKAEHGKSLSVPINSRHAAP